jgi:hypothetical protein
MRLGNCELRWVGHKPKVNEIVDSNRTKPFEGFQSACAQIYERVFHNSTSAAIKSIRRAVTIADRVA